MGRNSVSACERGGLSGSGDGERVEKSSEMGSDSARTSELKIPKSVKGAPNIWVMIQTQSSMTKHAKLVAW
jgi:hypothetical protein